MAVKKRAFSRRLERSNELATELNEASLLATVKANGLGQRITFNAGAPPTVEARLPSREEMRAFLAILRLFLTMKDGVGFAALARDYRRQGLPDSLCEEIERLWKDVDEYLEGLTPVTFNGLAITRRQVWEIMTYGLWMHVNERKADLCDSWKAHPAMFALLQLSYAEVLMTLTQAAFWLRHINLRALEHLEAS